jgi:L-ascorbate metabolism protein UlaG (beta-lactamase superfamily)
MRTLKPNSLTILFSLVLGWSSQLAAEDLTIKRLTWAGVELVSGETTVFIDPIGTDLWDGKAPEGFVRPRVETRRRYALITHAHNDHFDARGLKKLLGENGYVICHESIAAYVASRGLKVIPAQLYHPISRGGFWFVPVPASDGFGDPQVSWVVIKGDKRMFHGGDTLWHGNFTAIGATYGPFDIAFLPINGPRVGGAQSPAAMTPLQAIDAAKYLRARKMAPIHFGLGKTPGYVEVEHPVRTLLEIGAARGQQVVHLKPGDVAP